MTGDDVLESDKRCLVRSDDAQDKRIGRRRRVELAEAVRELDATVPLLQGHGQPVREVLAELREIAVRRCGRDARLGGEKTRMIGNIIADQFGGGNNWPLGSAMSVLLMGFILIGVFVYLNRVGEDAL